MGSNIVLQWMFMYVHVMAKERQQKVPGKILLQNYMMPLWRWLSFFLANCSNSQNFLKEHQRVLRIPQPDIEEGALNHQASVWVTTFLLMISALSRPPSPSLHLIISPNIITYSEALKRQPIPWHSKIHQESAASLKNLIKHAQHKHSATCTLWNAHIPAHSGFLRSVALWC